MKISRIGVDLAKNVFQLHGVDRRGQVVFKRRLRRDQWLRFVFANIKPDCVIGMEACGGAHHRARVLQARGYTVRLIPPQFVTPYVKSNKNDANDAETICEAMSRPHMRFVSVKAVEQQDIQATYRIRSELMKQRTAKAQRLRGVRPLVATALLASVGDGKQFKKGRQMAAALGLTPRQHSSGEKNRLLGISKRGDPYLRSILIHGARAVVSNAKHKDDRLSEWVTQIAQRRQANVAAVALANKTVRIACSMMRNESGLQHTIAKYAE